MDVCYGHRSGDNDMQDDLIYRQAAVDHFRRIIDATNTNNRYKTGFVDGLEVCINHLSTMPSAQPEIVRCKDCKYWGKRELCDKWDYYISNGDFYCGCAERRADE